MELLKPEPQCPNLDGSSDAYSWASSAGDAAEHPLCIMKLDGSVPCMPCTPCLLELV